MPNRQLDSSQCNFSTCFDHIHAFLEAQHEEIRASFERNLHIVNHKYRREDFKELRGFLSQNGLDLVLNACNHADRVSHTDETKCDCSLRCTHGLPCGHEIARYRKAGKPIYLTCIHQNWRKLSMYHQSPKVDLNCKTYLEMFDRCFNEANPTSQLHLLRQLRELASPETTYLLEPQVKTNNKGRPPKGKGVGKSIRCYPSRFEYASLGEAYLLPVSSKVFVTEGREKGRGRFSGSGRGRCRHSNKVHLTHSTENLVLAFPTKIQPFIAKIYDVEGDGNCCFRMIAAKIGFGDDGRLKVRKDLLDELLRHSTHYARLFKIEGKVDDVVRHLEYYLPCPSPQYWSTLPKMDYLVASCYNVVLFSFSHYLSITFFPIRALLVKGGKCKEIAIDFVNDNHFVEVFLHPNHPVPKVPTLWREEFAPVASSWLEPYENRFDDLHDISPTNETIDFTID